MIVCDENISSYWIKLLRNHGYEVVSICEDYGGISDREVIALAQRLGGLLITEDKDFGELVYAYNITTVSVVFLRYDQPIYEQVEATLLQAVKMYFAEPSACFITISKHKIRIRRL
jgi:predicted nuclease of predicted toxin-antitoxin system